MGKTVAYLRVSTSGQDVQNQELEIRRYAEANGTKVDEWVRLEMSTRRSMKERGIDELLGKLKDGDTLIVSALDRLGRSLSQIVMLVDELMDKGVSFVAVKQGMRLNGERDMTAKVQVAMFGLMAEIERDLISERTKSGLERARAEGKQLGRPKGLGISRLDSKSGEIEQLLQKGVSKASIAKIVDVAPATLQHFLKTRRVG